MTSFPRMKEEGFIQVGDFIGTGLTTAARHRMKRVHIVGMIGKLSKMAAGRMQTHAAGSRVDMNFLADLARQAGASTDHCRLIREQSTARFVLELAEREGFGGITDLICQKVCAVAERHTRQALKVSAYLFDFYGRQLAQWPKE